MTSATMTKRRAIITVDNPVSVHAEAYRTLRTNVQWSSVDHPLRTLLVTSAEQGAGKSTTAVNLAAAFALMGKKTVIVDADMRRPAQHCYFNKTNRAGLSNLLKGQFTLRQTVQETHVEGLSLLPSGTIPHNPAELLAGQRMDELLAELRQEYEFVLLDTTPVLAVTDAQVLGAKVDGVLFVLQCRSTKRELARKAIAQLEYMQSNVIGTVLNRTKKKKASYRYEM
ncbi:CpsD/CapB family tyrosine-protein kinase [Cohnella cellulosilytica]|uniref:non-specific protein-tyrosine kinase n=1 Tax=Cohnella cellulosilytica TaxID=986710 RepID=A0ABW2FMZ6_9BACL